MRRSLSVLAVTLIFATACANDPSAPTTTVTVFAASSLTVAFTQIGHDFETANPGVRVDFNFASSTDLAGQITSEATADVFASASEAAMDTVANEPGVVARADFATNRLVIITPPDNPAHVITLDDLTDPRVQLVIAAEGVPAGDYARQMLHNDGIGFAALANVVSNEPDDASVVAKVASGEADAGIVYLSDVASAGSAVMSIQVPRSVNVTATYPIAVVSGAEQAVLATEFQGWVLGPAGQAVLRARGFAPPPETG